MTDQLDNTELLAVAGDNVLANLSNRMTNTDLMALRAQMPFIHIMPFPNTVMNILLAANVAQDIQIPDQTKLVRFKGDGNYYVSRNGAAQIPDGTDNTKTSGSVMTPEDTYYYVEEIRQLSMISLAGCKVTMQCFIQL